MTKPELAERKAQHEKDLAEQLDLIKRCEEAIRNQQAVIARARDCLNAIGGALHETEHWMNQPDKEPA